MITTVALAANSVTSKIKKKSSYGSYRRPTLKTTHADELGSSGVVEGAFAAGQVVGKGAPKKPQSLADVEMAAADLAACEARVYSTPADHLSGAPASIQLAGLNGTCDRAGVRAEKRERLSLAARGIVEPMPRRPLCQPCQR
jgi:hypothetical protein